MLALWIIIFIISLVVLIKAAAGFTNSAEKIGLHFRIPPFLVGVTIVSFGTSLPELISSIIAVFQGASQIVVGNVIGSNIANIFLVLGIAAIIGRKVILTHEIAEVDLPLMIASAFLLSITIWDGVFSLFDAFLCLLAMAIYIYYTINLEKKNRDKEIKKEMKGEVKKEKLKAKTWLVLVISAAFIYLGARFTVESVINISSIIGVGSEIIAATAIALGTSIPELVVTVSAALRGKPEIAVGNVLGSNIFNALAVMGIPALFGTMIIPASVLSFALPMMLIATLLFFFMTQQKKLTRWEGWTLLIFYVFFIIKIINLG